MAEGITGVPAADIVAAAKTLWEARPVAFYTWSGLEQHSGTTQTIRAINVLYALTGSLDVPGGNVLFEAVPSNPIDGKEFLSDARPPAVGVERAAAGPGPVRIRHRRGLLHRGPRPTDHGAGELRRQHGDGPRGQRPRSRGAGGLDFFVHADLFMTPTAELADIVLPVATPFESEALKIGFEYSQEAQSLVQLRQPLVAPRGEARSDLQIVFDLATRLGLGAHFWDGDIDAAFRHQLAPSGITLEELRAHPEGVRVPLATRYRKYADTGFATPSRKVELYSATLAAHGYSPLPTFEEPLTSPRSRPDLADRYPLVLSCAKSLFFCETQHRQVAALRKSAPDPQVEMHPVHGRGPRHRRGRLGLPGHPARQRPGPREVQRQPRPAGRVRPARLVAGLRRAGTARLPAIRAGQRQPQPRAAPDAERPDQRQFAPAGVGLRRLPTALREVRDHEVYEAESGWTGRSSHTRSRRAMPSISSPGG